MWFIEYWRWKWDEDRVGFWLQLGSFVTALIALGVSLGLVLGGK